LELLRKLIKLKFVLTSHGIGSLAEYTAVKGWFSIGSIYAEDEDDYDNSDSDSETNGNHVGELIGF